MLKRWIFVPEDLQLKRWFLLLHGGFEFALKNYKTQEGRKRVRINCLNSAISLALVLISKLMIHSQLPFYKAALGIISVVHLVLDRILPESKRTLFVLLYFMFFRLKKPLICSLLLSDL